MEEDMQSFVSTKAEILIATSNRALDNIYERGLSRDLFLPFNSALKAEQGFSFVEKSPSGLLKQKFEQLISHHMAIPQEVGVVMGRRLQELCDRPLGAADYFGLFKSFYTLALDGVSTFGLHNKAAAYYFITLVNVMHENKA